VGAESLPGLPDWVLRHLALERLTADELSEAEGIGRDFEEWGIELDWLGGVERPTAICAKSAGRWTETEACALAADESVFAALRRLHRRLRDGD
jgi:hypothetical protein